MEISPDTLESLCRDVLRRAGANELTAGSLARATVAAETRGRAEVGVLHLLDYLTALRRGALNGAAVPSVSRSGAVVSVDAVEGTAQGAFDTALPTLLEAAGEQGIAVLRLHNSFTCGELAYYTTVLVDHGLMSLAVANSPALVAPDGTSTAVLGTNPMSFAAPAEPSPLVIDQGISAAAYVTVRRHAEEGREIPSAWAVDQEGRPTTDAADALTGSLRPAGGQKMTNIGLMVEALAAFAGARWSTDASGFDAGRDSPSVGMFLLAVHPESATGGYTERLGAQLHRLEENYGMTLPGRRRPPAQVLDIADDVYQALVERSNP